MSFPRVPVSAPVAGKVDWDQLKQEILGKLSYQEEYQALGVRFDAAVASPKGWRACHAIDRKDDVASAAVHIQSWVYHDSGGGGKTLGFFDFALQFGKFGSWYETIKHYAEKAGVPIGRKESNHKGEILEKVYEYRDATNELKYGVFRYRTPAGKKTFRQYPIVQGTWRKEKGCMEGVTPLPYRLPELLALDDKELILVVEGEKDCDRAWQEGFAATTNSQGAGSTAATWGAFIDVLPRRPVGGYHVVPHADRNGVYHAMATCRYLHQAGSLARLCVLPDLSPKGDLFDWFDRGGSPDDLRGLLAHSIDYHPEDHEAIEKAVEALIGLRPPSRPRANVADLRALMSATSWIWPLWVVNAALTLIASEAGVGKTRFCFDLHRRAYHGLPWPDGSAMTLPKGVQVLWVVADNQHSEMIELPAEFGIPDEAVLLNTMPEDPFGGTSLQTAEELEEFEKGIAAVKPAWVVIDTITNTSDYSSNDSADAKRQYKPLQEIAMRQQVPIICITHMNAQGKTLGRRANEKVRVAIMLSHPDKDQPHRRKVWVDKSKALKPGALGISMGDGGNEYDFNPPEESRDSAMQDMASPKVDKAKTWLKDFLDACPCRVSEARREAEKAGHNASTLYRAVEALGVIEYEVEGRKWWQLPADDRAE